MKTLPLLMSVVLLAALLHEGGVQAWGSRRFSFRFSRRSSVPANTGQCATPTTNPEGGSWRRSGSQLYLDCHYGYQLVGSSQMCHEGQWSGSSQTCIPTCNSASRPTLDHGTVSCFSQSCSFTCDTGYTLFPHTSTSATCSAPNTWSPSPPTCLMCMEPTLADGTVSCSGPESCSFTCDLGHVMFGSSSARCIGPHTWSPLPTCVRNCGEPATTPNVDYSGRVLGGHEAVAHSWPWMVALMTGETLGAVLHVCGGSLVDNQWVVTSAYCAGILERYRDQHQSLLHVVLGALGAMSISVPPQWIKGVARIIKHHAYASEDGFYSNDIALIKLTSPVTYSDEVHPVCLPAAGSSLPRGTQCVATGWGETYSLKHTQDKLRQVVLPKSTVADCIPPPPLGDGGDLPRKSFCAGVLDGGQELCTGDWGGPLVHEQGGVWTLVGVASYSKGYKAASGHQRCTAHRRFGNIFTNVAKFRSWLETTIRDNP